MLMMMKMMMAEIERGQDKLLLMRTIGRKLILPALSVLWVYILADFPAFLFPNLN